MTKHFGFHSNFRCSDEIKDLPISIDFKAHKHGVVTPVYYYISITFISLVELSKVKFLEYQTFKEAATRGVLQKKVVLKLCKINSKTPGLESVF